MLRLTLVMLDAPCVLFSGICVRVYYSKDVDIALLTHLKKSMVEGEQLLRVTVPCWDSASVAGCVCGGGGRVNGRLEGGTCYKMNPAFSSVSFGHSYLVLNQVFIVYSAA